MAYSNIASDRKKRIKKILSMMNKQNKRFIPVAPPLIEMMDLVTSDQEINYLLQMGTGLYDYKVALQNSDMPEEDFQAFFDEMKRKGLVYIENDESGQELYRLNAIAVGWYESMMHYIVGKPEEEASSDANWSVCRQDLALVGTR